MMNSERYLTELSGYLNPLSKEEKKNAMEYYREYAADIESNGEDIVEKLGTPRDLANSILSDNALKSLNDPDESVKKKTHGCLIALLVLFALPVGLPLAIAAFAIILAFGITGFALVLAFGLSGIGILVGAIVAVVAGFTFLFSLPMTGIAIIGMSMMMVGISFIAIVAAIKICQFVFWLIGKIFNKTVSKKEKEVQ